MKSKGVIFVTFPKFSEIECGPSERQVKLEGRYICFLLPCQHLEEEPNVLEILSDTKCGGSLLQRQKIAKTFTMIDIYGLKMIKLRVSFLFTAGNGKIL